MFRPSENGGNTFGEKIILYNIFSRSGRVILLFDTVNYIAMDQGEPGVDYNEPNLNPLVCDLCKQKFDTLDKLGEHQKEVHDI